MKTEQKGKGRQEEEKRIYKKKGGHTDEQDIRRKEQKERVEKTITLHRARRGLEENERK